jgi:hypothetical protein
MFNIEMIGAEAVEKRLADMAEKIRHAKAVDIGTELSDWQTEDMHRNRPFTMRSRAKGKATTIIRPHSLREMKHSLRYQRRMGRKVARGGKRAMLTFSRWEVKTSMRPILRSALEEQLMERVMALRERLKW